MPTIPFSKAASRKEQDSAIEGYGEEPCALPLPLQLRSEPRKSSNRILAFESWKVAMHMHSAHENRLNFKERDWILGVLSLSP